MTEIPSPLPVPIEDVNRKRIRFRFRYSRLKGSWSWAKLSTKDQEISCKKLREFSRYKVHQFKSCGAKLRKWNKDLPSPPDDLSQDIKDNLADYFKINQSIRAFGYLIGRDFHVIWISGGHKHSD